MVMVEALPRDAGEGAAEVVKRQEGFGGVPSREATEVKGEVVYRRACMHHHCMDCRGDEQGGCVVCAMEAEGK